MADEEETYDPFERFNRAMFAFNEKYDAWLVKPLAQGYDVVLPAPVKTGISNFFSNLWQPSVVVNDLLQGKGAQAASDTGRFLVNSTVGVAGLFDVGRHIGLPPHDEDFGQTLAVWGVSDGPYFVWPFVGPRNLRDSVGWVADQFAWPVNYLEDRGARWGLWALYVVDTRAGLLAAEKVLAAAAGDDKYLFVREAYRQRRISLIHDGNPPRPKFFDDEPAAAPTP